ncbi:MAG: AMP-binding protein, partial [Caulobacterales bacterium]|nr:AMP-binding protein [Caulobacterales bacterium]
MSWTLNADSPRTIGRWLRAKADRNGDKTALKIMGREKSYAGAAHDSARLAAGLLGLGLRPGDHVAVMMKTSLESVDAWFALCQAGLIEVPINTAYRGDVLHYIIRHSKARAILIDEEFLPLLNAAVGEGSLLRHAIVHRESEAGQDAPPAAAERHDMAALYRDETPAPPQLARDDAQVILYTSGTTGPSKGVVLSHEANLNLARHTVWLMGYGAGDVLYTTFPLFHVNAKFMGVMAAMEADGKIVMHQRFSASRFWDICREEGVTAFNYMGSMLSMLWKQPPSPRDGDNPVRRAVGAPCPADIFEPFEARFAVALTEVYGLTDCEIGQISKRLPWFWRIDDQGTDLLDHLKALPALQGVDFPAPWPEIIAL